MNKIEEKRQREISIVSKMIEFTVKRNMVLKMAFVLNVSSCLITLHCEATTAHSWKQKPSAQTAVCIVTNQK